MSAADARDRRFDCVVILDSTAVSAGLEAHPDRNIAFVGLQSMSGGGAGLTAFADPSLDIETVKKLVCPQFSAGQQAPWEDILDRESVEAGRQPDMLIEGSLGLAFGDTSPSARDIGAMGSADSHLLVSHVTHALTALHCKEALMTGSLIGMSGCRWSNALDGFDPGLERWRAVFEPTAACCCETTPCNPNVGCPGQR